MRSELEPGPGAVRALTAVLTTGCNLSCAYCFQNARSPRRSLSWPTLRSALDVLLASERDEVELTFTGGEPLLELPAIERALAYVRRHRRPGQTVRYRLYTNGMLLGERTAAFLAAHRVETQLSFDGVAAAQAYRGAKSFAALDALLDQLRERHENWFRRHLSVAMTVLPETVRHMGAGARYFLSKGVAEFGFSPIITDSSTWRGEQIVELEEQMEQVYTSCLDHYLDTGEVPCDVFWRHRRTPTSGPAGRPLCRVGRSEALSLDVDGQLSCCVLFSRSFQTFPGSFLRDRVESLSLGDLRSDEWRRRLAAHPAAVRAAEIFEHQERKYSSYRRCADCEALDTCQICPMAIGHIPGNTDPHRIPDFLCAFNLVARSYEARFGAAPSTPVGRAVTGKAVREKGQSGERLINSRVSPRLLWAAK